jgi:hypothetical protein
MWWYQRHPYVGWRSMPVREQWLENAARMSRHRSNMSVAMFSQFKSCPEHLALSSGWCDMKDGYIINLGEVWGFLCIDRRSIGDFAFRFIIVRVSSMCMYAFQVNSVRISWHWTCWDWNKSTPPRKDHCRKTLAITLRVFSCNRIITYVLRACGRPFLFSSTSA